MSDFIKTTKRNFTSLYKSPIIADNVLSGENGFTGEDTPDPLTPTLTWLAGLHLKLTASTTLRNA